MLRLALNFSPSATLSALGVLSASRAFSAEVGTLLATMSIDEQKVAHLNDDRADDDANHRRAWRGAVEVGPRDHYREGENHPDDEFWQ